MTKERRNSQNMELLTLLKRCAKSDEAMANLEHLLTVSCENSEIFQEQWLRPLLTEGLNLDEAFAVIVEGALRPS